MNRHSTSPNASGQHHSKSKDFKIPRLTGQLTRTKWEHFKDEYAVFFDNGGQTSMADLFDDDIREQFGYAATTSCIRNWDVRIQHGQRFQSQRLDLPQSRQSTDVKEESSLNPLVMIENSDFGRKIPD